MKKILLGFALSLATLSFAQQYPNNGWGDDGYGNNSGYYNDQDNQNYFPDDYYYNYPQDYYPNDYYQSYYNDYRNSIININWNVFFAQNRLTRWQIDQILYLNNLYSSFSAWNDFYRYNPDRWYYDRFYAMERILGPRLFVVFQNNYYQGYSPIVYFQNYRRIHYIPRYRVMPRYRNVNINIYRVDRAKFHRRDNPTLRIVSTRDYSGFRNKNNSGIRVQNNNGIRRNNNAGGFRDSNDSGVRNGNNGFRNGSSASAKNRGFRNSRAQETRRESTPKTDDNNRVRNGGFRQQRSGSSSPRIQNHAPRQNNNGGNESRGGGLRQRLVSN